MVYFLSRFSIKTLVDVEYGFIHNFTYNMTIYINRRFNNSNSDMGIKSCLLKRWTPPVWPIFEISKIVLIKTNKYHSKILLHLNRILTNLTFLNSIFQHGFCETHLDFISTIFLVYNSEFDLHKKAKTWISLKSLELEGEIKYFYQKKAH